MVLFTRFLLFVLSLPLFIGQAHALSVSLDGTRSVLTGVDCDIATYRFGTNETWNGTALDLYVEVLAEDNEYALGNCVDVLNGILAVSLRDTDPADDVAFVDLRLTLVAAGTTTPVFVDRITATGFDLDANGVTTGASSTSTDDIYLTGIGAPYLSGASLVIYTPGTYPGGHDVHFKGDTTGNCDDTPTTPVPECRAAAGWTGGGTNSISSINVRFQNDNAYGQYPVNNTAAYRLLQLSLEDIHAEQTLADTNDHGDLPASYGDASHPVVSLYAILGKGVAADNEVAAQGNAAATGDDNDFVVDLAKYDDEDSVSRNGAALDDQTVVAGAVETIAIDTFGDGYLTGWVDFNANGNFTDAGEQIINDVFINSATVSSTTLNFTVPYTATGGNTYARFRFNKDANLGPTGVGVAGEVEDYRIVIEAMDAQYNMVKTADLALMTAAGPITYTFTFENTGNAPLSNLTVTDPDIDSGSLTCPIVSLPIGQTASCSATRTVTQVQIDSGAPLSNTATPMAEDPLGGTASETTAVDNTTATTITASYAAAFDKLQPANADEDGSGDISAGDTLTYTATATNTGTGSLTNVVVTDAVLTPSSNSCAIVAPGGICVLTGTYIVQPADVGGDIVNNATADFDQVPQLADQETVTVPTAVLTVDKPAPTSADEDGSGDVSAGDTLTYTVTATNSGTGTLTNVIVSDTVITPGSFSCASVAPGATCVLTGTYVVLSTDVGNAILNEATADSDQTAAVTDTVTVNVPTAEIAIDKPAPTNADEDGSTDVSAGDTLTYTITATNTGAGTLTNVTITDNLITPNSVSCVTVTAASTCVLSGTYVVTAADVLAGSIDNTASAESDQTAPVTDNETVTVPSPSLTLNKPAPVNADEDGSSDVSLGDTLTYTITARNNGTAVLTNVTVSDVLITPASASCLNVAAGSTCVLTGTYVVTAADNTAGSIDNTASADSDQTPLVTDDETVLVPDPVHTLDKSVVSTADNDSSGDVSAGDSVNYQIVATNTGTAVLTNLTINDPLITPGSSSCSVVATGATCVLSGTYTVTAADVIAGTISNTASSSSDQTGNIDVSENLPLATPVLTIVKPAPANADEDGSGDISAGDTLTYTVTATNSGAANLTNVAVTDPLLTPSATSCALIASSASCVLTGTYTVTPADVVAGVINNTASADSDQTAAVTASQAVNPPAPAHTVDKSPPSNADEDGSADVSVGDTLTYTVTATNTGAATLTNVVVTDPMLTPATLTCSSVAAGGTCVLNGTYQVTTADISAGNIVNTASAVSDQTPSADDTETVAVPSPQHIIDKVAPANADEDGSGDVSAGDTLTYTVTATNTGSATLTSLVVTDSMLSPSSNSCATVVSGATCVLSGTYVVTAADIAAGLIVNTASSVSDQTANVDDTETVNVPSPGHMLDKAAPSNADEDGSGDISAADTLTYTVTATNNGGATLTNLIVSDPMISPASISCASVVAGNTCVLTGTYSVTAADVAAGSIVNTASSISDQTASVDDTETVNLQMPGLSIDKPAPINADEDGSTDVSAADTLTYTVTATNNGSATLTNVVVSDSMIAPSANTCAVVAAGDTCVLTGTYVVSAGDITAGVITNTATADSDQTPAVTDDESVPVLSPGLVVDKPAPVNTDEDGSADVSVGDTLTYTITATNNGATVLTNVVVSDPLVSPSIQNCASVAPAAVCTLTGNYVVAAADLIAGSINNTATADSDQTSPVTDTATVTLLAPSIGIDKPAPANADEDGSTDVSAGDTLTYTITATNNGAATLTNVVVSDPMISPSSMSCAIVTTGATCVLIGNYTVTPADILAGVIDNTATADSDQTTAVTDDETVPVLTPGLTIDKPAPTNGDQDGSTDVSAGDVLTYTITATNIGGAILTNVTINDPLLTPGSVSCASLVPTDTCVLTGSYTVTTADIGAGSIDNLATADSDQTTAVADDHSEPVATPALILDKATPALTDTDASTDISAGDTLTYTVTATNNGAAVLTNVVVDDSLITPSNSSCASLVSGASCVLTGDYIVTAADVAAGVINNTATANSDQTVQVTDTETVGLNTPSLTVDKPAPANSDEDGSADVSVGDTLTYTITATNNGAAVLTDVVVSDSLITPSSNTCATLAVGADCVLTGTYVVTAADLSTGTISNTATADSDQTGQVSDTELVILPAPSVTINKPAPLNADEDNSGDVSVGDTLTYTITVINNGAATLTNVLVSDPKITPNSINCATLAAGSTCVLSGNLVVSSADVTAGVIVNTASAQSDQTASISDDETVNLPTPAITIVKPAPLNGDQDGSSDISVNDVLTYTVTASNTGTATLTNVVVSDPMLSPSSTSCASLAAGSDCVLSGNYTVTAADVATGVIDNTASADSDQTVAVNDSNSVTLGAPALSVNKPAPVNGDQDGSGDVSVGDVLTYTITATNTGASTLTAVVVDDPMLSPSSAGCVTVTVGNTCILSGTYIVTAADVTAGTINNTATADSAQTPSVSDTESVIVPNPLHTLVKGTPVNADEDGSGDVSTGDTLTYTITATNTGTANLTNLAVSDPQITPSSTVCGSVFPAGTCVLTGNYTVGPADLAAGVINNTATSVSNQSPQTEDSQTVILNAPGLTVAKPAPVNSDEDGSSDVSVGDTLTYIITATNNGSANLTNVVVTDTLITPGMQTCASVAPGNDCVLSGTYSVTPADVSAGNILNTASADSDQTSAVMDDEDVIVPTPQLIIDKPAPSNADEDGSTDVSAGDTLSYTITATNTGTANLTNVVVSDPMLAPASTNCSAVAPGAACVLIGSYMVTPADVKAAVINNTASADSDQTGVTSDSESVAILAPSHSLNKPAPANADEDSSGDVSAGDTLTYTITATNDGAAVLTNLTISDPMITPSSVSCASVAPLASCVLTGSYLVTSADVVSAAIFNTASSQSDQTAVLTDDETVSLPQPQLDISKPAPVNGDQDSSGDVSVGDVLTYTITATNSGTAVLTNVVVTDTLVSPVSNSCAQVLVGADCVLTGTYTVTAGDVASGSIDNTAAADSDQTNPVNDTHTVALASPDLSIDKPAPVNGDQDGSGDISAGDVLTYTITATNSGASTLTNVVVDDAQINPNQTTCNVVPVGGDCLLVGDYTVTTADVTAGVINNTATADSVQTPPASDSESVVVPSPLHTLVKSLPTTTDNDSSGDISAGDTLNYTVTATNSGTATLTNLLVSDGKITPAATNCPVVAVGGTCVLAGIYTVTAADVIAGSISNIASSVSDQSAIVEDTQTINLNAPSLVVNKPAPVNADEDGSTDVSVGDTLIYTITATNNGSSNLTNVVVSDSLITPASHTCASLTPGNDCVLTGSYTVTSADVAAASVVNTASAVSDQTPSVSDNENVSVPNPVLTVNKPAPVNGDQDGSGDVSAGDILTYTITATNTGTATLTNVLVNDSLISPASNTCVLVAPGATCVLSGTYTVSTADVAAATVDNTATAQSDQTPISSDSESVPVLSPLLAISKAAPVNSDEDGSSDVSVADTLTYTITASNSGAAVLTNVVVSDAMLIPSTANCATLAPGGSCVLTGSYTVTAADVVAGVIDNTASAVSDQAGPVDDTESVALATPGLAIDKPAPLNGDQDGSGDVSAGDILTYTVTATNSGSAVLTNVVVNDPLITPSSQMCASVAAAADCVLTGTYTVTSVDVASGAIDNTATANSDQTGLIGANQSVAIPAPGLAIDKPAPANGDQDGSGDVSAGDVLTYTITATNTGGSTLTGVVVNDPLIVPASVSCATVTAGATCVLTGDYIVTVADVGAGVINNTATADSVQTASVSDNESVPVPTPVHTLSKAAPVNTDNDASADISAGDTLTYTITATNTGLATLTNMTISDAMLAPASVTCATVTAGAVCVLVGDYTVTAADVAAGSIDNTADSQSDQTGLVDDSQTVYLNAPGLDIDKPSPINADEDGSTDISVGDTLTYTITASNNGSSNLTDVVVTDPLITPSSLTCATVLPGDTCVLAGGYVVTAADVAATAITNTATANSDQTAPVIDDQIVVVPAPQLTLSKPAPVNGDQDGSSDVSAADVLTYTITATNTGSAILTDVLVSDPLIVPTSAVCAALSPGADCVLSGDYTVTAADVNAAVINNTASATSDQTAVVTDTESVVLLQPLLAIDKPAPVNGDQDGSGDVSVGDVLTYTVTASNNGTSTLTSLVVSDPLITPSAMSCGVVSAGGTCVLTGTYTVTAADVASGAIDNTAMADSDQTVPVNDSYSLPLTRPALAIDKAAPVNADQDGSGDISSGDVLTYTVTATNAGGSTLTNLVVSDPLLTPGANTCAVVTVGNNCVLSGSYTVSVADVLVGVINNTATADSVQTAMVSDNESVMVPQPVHTLTKTGPVNTDNDGSGDVSVGDTLAYTVTATNTGTATLTNMVISDPQITPSTITCGSLAPGADCILTGTYTVTAADIASGTIDNTATSDSIQSAPADDTQSIVLNSPSLVVNKPAPVNTDEDSSTDVSVGDTLTYTITASNNGSSNLTNVVITDSLISPNTVSCAVVPTGGDCVLTGTYSVTAADIIAGAVVNTASADSDQTDSVTDDATVPVPAPNLVLNKPAPVNADNDGSTDISVGDILSYTITASNTGTSVLTNVQITDPMLTPSSITCAAVPTGASCVLAGTYTVTASDVAATVIDNTAEAVSDQTVPVNDTESVTVPQPLLTLTKAMPVNGDQDNSTDVSVGDVLSYTITATNAGTSVLTNVQIDDGLILPASTSCAIVAAGDSCVLTGTYTVTAADVASGSIDNTATAASDQSLPASDNISVPLTLPQLAVDKTTPLNDDRDGSGDISATDELTYTITATNTGSSTLTDLVVSDPLITPASINCPSVPVGGTCVLTGTYIVTTGDVAAAVINNTASADSVQTPLVSDSETVVLPTPQHTLHKANPVNADQDGSGDVSVGDSLSYTITASNTGTATLTNLNISDSMITPSVFSCPSVLPAATCELTGTYTVTAADIAAGVINNVASSFSDQTGVVDDTQSISLNAPGLAIDKPAPVNTDEDGSSDVSIGDTLTYTITATNNGSSNLTNVTVSDPLIAPHTQICASVPVGASCILVGDYVVTAADILAGAINNEATADSVQTASVKDSQVVAVPAPSLALYKPVPVNGDQDGSGDISQGDLLTYTVTATNTGTAILGNVVVSDALISPNTTSCTMLSPGASCQLTGSYSVTQADVGNGSVDNIATAYSDQTAVVSASQNVPVPVPQLSLSKPAPANGDQDGSADVSAGDILSYSITATNTGTATLTNVVVNDPLLLPETISCAFVAAGDSCVLHGNYTVLTTDIAAGTIANNADAISDQTGVVQASHTIAVPVPAHSLSKAAPINDDADASADVSTGDTLTYTITATNTGSASLTNLTISDPLIIPTSVVCALMLPGDTCVLSGSYPVKSTDIAAGFISNTASSVSDQSGQVDDTETQNLAGPSHSIDKVLSANADEDGSADVSAGDTLTYTVTASNNGNANLTNMIVTDALLTPSTQQCAFLVPGDDCVLTGYYKVTPADVTQGDITNTATSITDQTGFQEAAVTVMLPTPAYTLAKSLAANADEDRSADISAGDTLSYAITATNTGSAVLTEVLVSDPLISPSIQVCPTVAPGSNCILSGQYTVTPADVATGLISNTATADTDQLGQLSDVVNVNVPQPELIIEKTLSGNSDEDGSGDISLGDTLTYTVTATNSGTGNLTNLLLTDQLLLPSTTSCTQLTPGDSCVLSGTYQVLAADILNGQLSNTATAVADQVPPVSDTVLTLFNRPALSLHKTLTANLDEDGSGEVSLNDTIEYAVTATNDGTAVLTNVVVTDPLLTPSAITCALLAPQADCTLSGSYTIGAGEVEAGALVNTASVDSTQTTPVQDTHTVVVPPPGLTLVKGAPINADADGTGSVTAGDTLTYTITATNTGNTALTQVVISDPLLTPGNHSCALLASGDTCVLTGQYTVAANDAQAGQILNTANVIADQMGPIEATHTQVVVQLMPPVTSDDTRTDQPLAQAVTVTVLSNDTDSDNAIDPATVVITDPVSGDAVTTLTVAGEGLWTVDAVTGDITFTPQSEFRGDPTPVNYTVKDVTGLISNSSIVTIDYQAPAAITGTVWLDVDRDGEIDPTEPVKAGWTLKIYDDAGKLVAETITDAAGQYSVTDLIPAEYTVHFFNEAGVYIAQASTGGVLVSGQVVNLPLPVDPSGVVYDSVTREPVPGVTLRLLNSLGIAIDPVCLSTNQQGQITQTDGLYAFDVFPQAHASCPDGEVYTIEIHEVPATYVPGISENIPPDLAVFDGASIESACTVDAYPDSGACEVQVQPDAPEADEDTQYFLSFRLSSGDNNVIFNHLPVDPFVVTQAAMALQKTVSRATVSAGDVFYYTIRVQHTADEAANDVAVTDNLPRGFRYVPGSANVTTYDPNQGMLSQRAVITTGIDPVVFTGLTIPAEDDGDIAITYAVRAGARVVQGQYSNTAQVTQGGSSNVGMAKVTVVADPLLDNATLVGKVFHDRDADGYQEHANATDITIKSDYFKNGYRVGDLAGRPGIHDQAESLTINMPVADNYRFELTTAQGTYLSMNNSLSVVESHTGQRARGLTAQDIRIEVRLTDGVPTMTNRQRSTDVVEVLEIKISNVGVHEEGIPGVRLATVEGLVIETDQAGRFHIPDIETDRSVIGRQYIVKLDPATIPRGATLTTENPRVLRITNAALNTMRFGIQLPRTTPALAAAKAIDLKRVEATLGSVFFDLDKHNIREDQQGVVADIIKRIREFGGGHILIEAHTDPRQTHQYNIALATRRARTVEQALRRVLGDELMQRVVVEVDATAYPNDEQIVPVVVESGAMKELGE